MSLLGSIQSDVPVKPVWPKEPMGKTAPRGREKAELMSQPKPRVATPLVVLPSGVKMVAVASAVDGCSGSVISLSVDCLSGKWAGVVQELVEQGLGEERDVVGGAEDAGVAGDSAHAAGGGVVDGAAEHVVEVGIGGCGCLRRRRWWERCAKIQSFANPRVSACSDRLRLRMPRWHVRWQRPSRSV